MTENALQDSLHAMIETLLDAREGADEEELAEIDDLTCEAACIRSVGTYKDLGMLTDNAGLVLTMNDGSEFRLTIVRSR